MTRTVRVKIAGSAPLVGRTDELQRLLELLEAAKSRRPQMAILRGDAGIGKTRLIQELIRHTSDRTMVRVSHCSRHLAAPYAPLIMLLDRAIKDGLLESEAEREIRGLVHRLTSAQDASLRDEAPDLEQSTARVRLYLELLDALEGIVRDGPTILVLEDVHWIDRGTAQFLEFLELEMLEGNLALPLLLVLTRRDLERTDDILDRLEQTASCTPVHLHPLGESEIYRLIRGYGIARPSRALVSTVFELSKGNPLYVQEVLRQLQTLDAFAESEGRIETSASPRELSPPRNLSELIDRRLQGVPEPVLDLLRLASVIGDELEPGHLSRLHGDAVAPLLDQAVGLGLLVDRGDVYAFAHPIMRQVVYDRLPRETRRELHCRIAHYLETDRTADHTLEIAHHLLESGEEADKRSLEYVWRAGLQAHRVGAWRGAIRFLEGAIRFGERLGVSRREMGWFRYWAGRSHLYDSDSAAAVRLLREAAEIGETSGDIELWSRAVLDEVRHRLTSSPDSMRGTIDTLAIDEVLTELDDQRPDLRGPLLSAYCTIRCLSAFDFNGGIAMGEEAVRLAHLANDAAQIATAESTLGMAFLGMGDARQACEHFELARRRANETGDAEIEGYSCARRALALWMLGRVDEAELASDQASDIFDSIRHHNGQCLIAATRTALGVVRGDFDSVEHWGRIAEHLYEQSEYGFGALLLYSALVESRSARGDHAGAAAALEAWRATGQAGRFLSRLVALVRSGRLEEARQRLSKERQLFALALTPSLVSAGSIGSLAEAAASLGDRDLAAELEQAIEKLPDLNVVMSPGSAHLLPRTRGVLAALLGRGDHAEHWLAEAILVAERSGALPELGRAHLDLGRLLVEDPSRERQAGEHLTLALNLFERLGMPGELTECQTSLDELPGGPIASASSARRFLLMSDIASSTEIAAKEGDEAYYHLVEAHDAILRRRLRDHGGIEVDTVGDGMLAWLGSSAAAVRCALDVLSDISARNLGTDEPRLDVRIGLTSGTPIERAGRLYGLAVSRCSRLCERAPPGQVISSEEFLANLPREFKSESLGPLSLHGFPEPVGAYLIRSHQRGAPGSSGS